MMLQRVRYDPVPCFSNCRVTGWRLLCQPVLLTPAPGCPSKTGDSVLRPGQETPTVEVVVIAHDPSAFGDPSQNPKYPIGIPLKAICRNIEFAIRAADVRRGHVAQTEMLSLWLATERSHSK